MKIAFDIQGVLISNDNVRSETMINLLKMLKEAGHFIIVWSGDDIGLMKKQMNEIGIMDYIDFLVNKMNIDKDMLPDIAFDDNELVLARYATIKI